MMAVVLMMMIMLLLLIKTCHQDKWRSPICTGAQWVRLRRRRSHLTWKIREYWFSIYLQWVSDNETFSRTFLSTKRWSPSFVVLVYWSSSSCYIICSPVVPPKVAFPAGFFRRVCLCCENIFLCRPDGGDGGDGGDDGDDGDGDDSDGDDGDTTKAYSSADQLGSHVSTEKSLIHSHPSASASYSSSELSLSQKVSS